MLKLTFTVTISDVTNINEAVSLPTIFLISNESYTSLNN